MEPVFAVAHDAAVQPPPPPYGLSYQTAPPPQVQQGGGGGGGSARLVLRLVLFLAVNVAFAFAIYRKRHNPRDIAPLIVAHVVFSVLFFCVPKLKQLRRDRKQRAAETALRELSPEEKV